MLYIYLFDQVLLSMDEFHSDDKFFEVFGFGGCAFGYALACLRILLSATI